MKTKKLITFYGRVICRGEREREPETERDRERDECKRKGEKGVTERERDWDGLFTAMLCFPN